MDTFSQDWPLDWTTFSSSFMFAHGRSKVKSLSMHIFWSLHPYLVVSYTQSCLPPLTQGTATSCSTSAQWWGPTSRWRVWWRTWRRGGRGSWPTEPGPPSWGPSGCWWPASSSTWASSAFSAPRCCGNHATAPTSRTPPPASARRSDKVSRAVWDD